MQIARITRLVFFCFITGTATFAVAGSYGQAAGGAAGDSGKSGPPKTDAAKARLSHGTKLMLKDGNFQLVRSYQRQGDRVRYFSVERGDWEEIPAAMVDWDATSKAERDAEKADEVLVSKIHKQEEATKIETTLDVDASLRVANGVFLPPGEGMFAV